MEKSFLFAIRKNNAAKMIFKQNLTWTGTHNRFFNNEKTRKDTKSFSKRNQKISSHTVFSSSFQHKIKKILIFLFLALTIETVSFILALRFM